MRPSILFLALLGIGIYLPAAAHHSRANFQLDNLVEMEGTVTDYKWANPHIYFKIELESGESWLVEGHSVPGALGLGWLRDSIQIGDHVQVSAYPDRNTERNFALVEWAVLADGTVLPAFRRGSLPNELLARAGPSPSWRGAPVEPSTDFAGNWRVDLRGRNLRAGGFAPGQGMPLTAEGQQSLDGYDPNENPNFQCVSAGLPFTGPYGLRFDRYEDRLTMEKEHQDVRVTVWLDGSAAPQNAPLGEFGTSVGHLEGENTLVFETTGFLPRKWGVSRGVDSSDQKRIEARFELHPDGSSIDFTYRVFDPVYLTEPLVRTGVLLKEADREFIDEPCDPEISSLHLSQE